MTDEGYKKLEIYQMAHTLAVEVHGMTLKLPKFEMYEEGSQIRRSSKSVAAQIVEGYCRRKFKGDFLLYLTRAYAECSETIEHLELLYETKSLAEQSVYNHLRDQYETLSKKIFRFNQSVSDSHDKPYYVREDEELHNTNTRNP